MSATQTTSNGWRQLFGGLATGIIAVVTVLSALLLSTQEAKYLAPTAVVMASSTSTATAVPISSPTLVASQPATLAPVITPSASPTLVPTIACPPQPGWSLRTIRTGETLDSIASTVGANPYILIQGNCLVNTDLTPGQTLYVPPQPTRSPGPTPTRIRCGPPMNWVIYRVQPGDTLYGLSIRYGTSVYALAQANCLTGYTLRINQPLYVPPVIIIAPTWTATRVPPSLTPIITPSPSVTISPGVTPSRTPTVPPSATPTSGPSATPLTITPTTGPTNTPQPPTATIEPSATPPATTPPPTATTPPTATPLPPTATSVPPSATPVPPPASATPVPSPSPNPSVTP